MLNRDFICLRSSRKGDGYAQGEVAKLGFDWKDAHSDELIEELNAHHADLLGDLRRISVRGRITEVTPQQVPGVTDWCAGRLKSNYQFYLLTPQGKAIDLEFNERDPRGAEYWEVGWTSRFVMPRLIGERSTPLSQRRIEWHVGTADQAVILKTLARVSQKYPAKADRLDVPWQVDASFAVRWAKRDQKRILVVPAPGGRVDPALHALLSSRDVLRRFGRSYSFLKLDPARAGELKPTLEALNEGGLAVCDIPRAGCAVEWLAERHPLTVVVETSAGPHSKASLTALLEKHAVGAGDPSWIQLSKAERAP